MGERNPPPSVETSSPAMLSPHTSQWMESVLSSEEIRLRNDDRDYCGDGLDDDDDDDELDEDELMYSVREFHDIDPQDLHLIRLISDGSNTFADVWEASCRMKVTFFWMIAKGRRHNK